MTVIEWQGPWQPFDAPDKEHYFLKELASELQGNSEHSLHNKRVTILGWIPGCDDFILTLVTENKYAYVHLTWHHEDKPQWPYYELLANRDSVNRFLHAWSQEC